MSLKTVATSATVIASLLVASMGPLASAANAAPRYKKFDSHSYARHYDGGHRHDGPRYRYVKRRHNHGKDIATGIAIGLGVLAVGSILAQAHR